MDNEKLLCGSVFSPSPNGESLIAVSSVKMVFFADQLIVPELCFEFLLFPGDPIPPSLIFPLSKN